MKRNLSSRAMARSLGLGLSALAAVLLPASGRAYELTSPNAETQGRFGQRLAFVPDVNDDGVTDLIVGAPQEDVPPSFSNAGRVYLFDGATGQLIRTITSPEKESGANFGAAVAGLADLNGDGHGEIAVGSPNEDPGASPTDAGRVYIFNGATGGQLRSISSVADQAGGHFGFSLAALADLTGDGRQDLAIGAPNENPAISPDNAGRVYLVNPFNGALINTLISPNDSLEGRFGICVSAMPDAISSQRGYVLVGAPYENPAGSPSHAGRAYVFVGSTGNAALTFISNFEENEGQFGISVAGVPDLTGDGLADVAIGAWNEDPGAAPAESGRVVVYNGSTGVQIRALSAPGALMNAGFGFSVSGVPDMNADLRGEILIGAPGMGDTVFNTPGRAYLFSGIDGSLMQTINALNPVNNGRFGSTVVAGPDFTGDAKPDFAIWAEREPSTGMQQGRVHTFSGADGSSILTPSPTPTPSPTESPTPSPTESPTPTDSPTDSPTDTPTPSPTYLGRAFGDFDNSMCTDLLDFLFLLDNWEQEVDGSILGLNDFLALLDYYGTGPTCQ